MTASISDEQLFPALVQASRAELLASMSRELAHDLKSPIQALFLFDFEDTGPEMEEAFRSIVDRMAATVDRVTRLYLPRPTTRAGNPFTVPDLIDGLREISEVQRGLPKVRLSFDVPPGLPAIDGSVAEWQHVLINLIMNAREAAGTDPGATVSVTARPADGGVSIEVRDSGPGIPADRREWAFQPFTTTRDNTQGRGLGLPVARWLAQRNGGTLRLAAGDPGNTCLVVTMKEMRRG